MRGVYNLPFVSSFLGRRIKPTAPDLLQVAIGDDVFQNFSNAYFNLLAAIADNDLNFIARVCHEDLFNRLEDEMKIVEQNNLNIQLYSPSDTNANDGKLKSVEVKSPSEHYWQSKDTLMDVAVFSKIGLSMATRHEHKNCRVIKRPRRSYYLNFSEPTTILERLIRDQIIVLFVDIVSMNKLCICTKKDQVVQGSEKATEGIRSVVRFESDSEKLDFRITDVNHMLYADLGFAPQQVKQVQKENK